ncbi:MAG: hypothetical protein N3F08_01845 [Crenarchaeota archaeon]|nr:hypothetical protein [Thermoproteota archaeon]
MGSTANHVFCSILVACLTLVAVTACPEKTFQTGLQIIGSEADYVVFNGLTVVGGNVYIGGCSGSFENHVWTIWKISVDGRLVSSATGGKGYVISITSDGLRIYVAGVLEHDTLPKTTGFLAAFNTNLEKLWEKEWVGSSLFSHFESIVVQDEALYVAGEAQYFGERATEIVLHKYDENGSLLWEKTFVGVGHQESESMTISNGEIYIVGTTSPYGSSELIDGLLLVADEDGNEANRVSWGGEKRDFFSDVKVGDEVYVCGYTDSYGKGDLDGLLLKMDRSGKVVWRRTFGGAGDDSFLSLCIDSDRIHVVGHVTTSRGMLPIYLQYGFNGTLLGNWTLAIDSISSWTWVYAADGAIHMVGNNMRGLFRNRGIYTRYVTSYLLTVNFPGDGLWASLDGENKTGRSVSFEATGVEHRLEAAPYRAEGETRLAFSMWSDSVTDNPRGIRLKKDTVLDAVYRVEHHVSVSSEIGEASGGGWYVEGSIATVSVASSIIPKDFFTNHVFDGWVENGEKVSSSTVYSFVVTKPVRLVARWRAELNPVALCILLLLVILLTIAVLLVFLTRKKRRKPPALPPPPPPPDQA